MSLRDRITEDMKTAMRAKDAGRLLTIRGLLAAIKQREVDDRITMDDGAIVSIIDKLVKQRKDSISQFAAGNRPDLVDKESAELAVLEGYLPQRLGSDDVAAEVDRIIVETGASGLGDMRKVMAVAKERLSGAADMALVSAAVKHALTR